MTATVPPQLVVMPAPLMMCKVCKRSIEAEVTLEVPADFELSTVLLDQPALVGLQPVGVKVAHECGPGASA